MHSLLSCTQEPGVMSPHMTCDTSSEPTAVRDTGAIDTLMTHLRESLVNPGKHRLCNKNLLLTTIPGLWCLLMTPSARWLQSSCCQLQAHAEHIQLLKLHQLLSTADQDRLDNNINADGWACQWMWGGFLQAPTPPCLRLVGSKDVHIYHGLWEPATSVAAGA